MQSNTIPQSFHSEGEGKGCTFYVEFPFYNRRKVSPSPAVAGSGGGCPSNLLAIASNNSFAVITPATSRVFPEMMVYNINNVFRDADADVADLEMGIAQQQPQILIVDDSSANRYVYSRITKGSNNANNNKRCIHTYIDT
jgi:hypothetical protein